MRSRIFKCGSSEGGNMAGSLFLVVSIVTTIGIYQKNSSNLSAIQSSGLSREQADAYQTNLSALAVAQALFQSPSNQPIIYPDPYLNPPSPGNRHLAVRQNTGSNWQVSGDRVNRFAMRVRSPDLSNLGEADWAAISSGNHISSGDIISNLRLNRINTSTSHPHYLESVDVEVVTAGQRRSAPYQLRARLDLPPPPLPECEFSSNAASRSAETEPVEITLSCNSVIVAANIRRTSPSETTFNLDVSEFNRINNDPRQLDHRRITRPGDYQFQSTVFGVVGSVTSGLKFQIAPSPPPSPSPTPIADSGGSGSSGSGSGGSGSGSSGSGSSGSGSSAGGSGSATTCSGRAMFGYCYFYGASGQNCNRTCSDRGLSFHQQGSAHVTHSGRCNQIMNAFNIPSGSGIGNPHPRMGCKYHTGGFFRGRYVGSSAVNGTERFGGSRRICACR